jgi:hypothetical protein
MFSSTNYFEKMCLSLPITSEQRLIAQKFARQQVYPAKSLQVELNTLAIFAVKNYLDMMDISTSLEDSDSWNPAIRLCADIADLEIVGIGKLECIAIPAGTSTFSIPLEVWEDRIGYVIVEIDESYKRATLKGFLRKVTEEQLELTQILPIESLLDRLQECQNTVHLRKWLDKVFERDWQPVDRVLSPELAKSNFRLQLKGAERSDRPGYVEAGKLIDLGIQLKGFPIALLLDFKPEDETNTSIRLQVHPGGKERFLPPDLQLMVLDDSGEVFLEAKSREMDNYTQLVFSGEVGEHFSVQIVFGDVKIEENFVI